MARDVKKWVGKTDNAMPPPSVRLRIFERHNGTCHISGRKIRAGEKWDLDHIIPLADNGENNEDNLAPALVLFHRIKTIIENKDRAKAKRIAIKHIGAKKKKPWSRFTLRMDGTVIDPETGEPVGGNRE